MAAGKIVFMKQTMTVSDKRIIIVHDTEPGSISEFTYKGRAWAYAHTTYGNNPNTGAPWEVGEVITDVAGRPVLGSVMQTSGQVPHLHIQYVEKGTSDWMNAATVDNPIEFLNPNQDTIPPVIELIRFRKVNDYGVEQSDFYDVDVQGRTLITGNVQIETKTYDEFDGFGARNGIYSMGFEVSGPRTVQADGTEEMPIIIPYQELFKCDGTQGGDWGFGQLYDWADENQVLPFGRDDLGTKYNFSYVPTRANGVFPPVGSDLPYNFYWNIKQKKSASNQWYSKKFTSYDKATNSGDAFFPDGIYKARIKVTDYQGNMAEKEETIKIDNFMAPSAPANLASATGDSSVKLTWTKPEKNTDGSPLTDLAGYKIYYDTDEPGGSYTGTGATEGDSPIFVSAPVGTGPVEFNLTGLIHDGNTVYFIMVRAVDTAGNESADSKWVAVRPMDALWVPGEYGTIQAAIDAAQPGQTVMVSAGDYSADHLHVYQGIALRSESGPDRTAIVRSGHTDLVVEPFHNSKVIGFTIRSDFNCNYGVKLYLASGVEVKNNVITANTVGLYLGGVETGVVANNTIVANKERGLYVSYWVGSAVRVINNIIAQNGNYGIYRAQRDLPTFSYNDVWGQVADYWNLSSGNGDLSLNPLFIPSIDPSKKNYHLQRDSPCRNKGSEASEYNDYWENYFQITDPITDHKRNDMGAYGGPEATWRMDSDRDGLWDWTEDANHNGVKDPGETDPYKADNDNDGRIDGNLGSEDLNANGIFEPELGETDPRNIDTDGDGIQDGTEVGLTAPESADTDLAVFIPDADPSTTTDPLNPDTDGDGLSDGQEDADHNGAVGAAETDPRNSDSDGDGFSDGAEVAGGTDPLDPTSGPNHQPAISTMSVSQRTDGSGLAKAVFAGVDPEGDLCTLTVKEVSRDGVSWIPVPVVTGDAAYTAVEPLAFSPGGSSYTLVWNAQAAFGEVEDGEVYLRLQPHDGRLAGEIMVRGPFAVDTVPPQVVLSVPALSNRPVTPIITVSDGLDSSPSIVATLDDLPWSGGTIGTEGRHTLFATARDDYGNSSSAQALFTIDLTPPAIAFDGAVDGGIYALDVTASWTVTDNLDPAPQVTANYASPHLFDFSGRYTVQVTATDAAGNVAVRNLAFAIYDLADLPAILGAMSIEAGLKNSLLSKVENALAARDRGSVNAAVNLLEAFIHAVEAQRGKKITLADAETLLDFATHAIALLRNSWSALSLGEVFLSADDPALVEWSALLDDLEANAVSRIVLELYRAQGSRAGRLRLAQAAAWAGRGTLTFAPPFAFDLAAFLAEAERRGIDVLAGMGTLTGGATPGDALHLGHLTDMASYLLNTYPELEGLCLTDLEAPGQAAAVNSLAATMKTALSAVSGKMLALLVGSPTNDGELLALAEGKGQDLTTLGGTADLLYLETFVHEDANRDGLPDHEPSWSGDVVSYVGALGLSAGLVPLVPTYDVMEPFEDPNGNGIRDAGETFVDLNNDGQWGVNVPMTPERITTVVSGLPGSLVRGIAVYRYGDTSAAEWAALLNSHPQ